jgi:PhnB protein
MNFYQSCLGGELVFQTIGESPLSDKMPESMKNCILHSSLKQDNFEILASDIVGNKGYQVGNNNSILIYFDSQEDFVKTYNRLSEGGEKLHQPEVTFWGALFADLKDRYGNQWLLHFIKPK